MAKNKDDKSRRLALKLNMKMFGIQLSSFLALDVILLIILFMCSIVYAEHGTSQTLKDLRNDRISNSPTLLSQAYTNKENIKLGSTDISFTNEKPDKNTFTEMIDNFFPDYAEDGGRYFSAVNNRKISGFLKSVDYHVVVPVENDTGYMDISTNVGRGYFYGFYCMIILLVIQLLMLIDTAFSSRKTIAKALEPLRELSQATQAFSDAVSDPTGQYDSEALKNLARALDNVNATHLDEKIPADLMTEELKPLAAAINEMLTRINESYNSQIRFVSDASHELRTPIAVIQGYADLLSRWGTEDKDTLEESINAIRSEAESMKQLVNQLLFLARGDTDSMYIERKKLNLSDIVDEVVKELEMIDKTHTIQADIAPVVTIEGDPGLIKQLLRILTDNSIKYTPDGGKITVKLTSDNEAKITIQDEGVGIPENILPYIFDRFVRSDESRARNTGGAGLGLSIGKWITEKHGGHLEVLSREGIGTRFTVVLPLIDERPVVI